MPAVMEQVDKLSADEKLRLIVHIVESLSASNAKSGSLSSIAPDPARRKKPCVSDFIGYGARFHELRPTEEWMKELREGEGE